MRQYKVGWISPNVFISQFDICQDGAEAQTCWETSRQTNSALGSAGQEIGSKSKFDWRLTVLVLCHITAHHSSADIWTDCGHSNNEIKKTNLKIEDYLWYAVVDED